MDKKIKKSEHYSAGYIYKILFLYSCFLDGWTINIENQYSVKLRKKSANNFNLNTFIAEYKLL